MNNHLHQENLGVILQKWENNYFEEFENELKTYLSLNLLKGYYSRYNDVIFYWEYNNSRIDPTIDNIQIVGLTGSYNYY